MAEYTDPSLKGKKILVEIDLKYHIHPGEAIRVDIVDNDGKVVRECGILPYECEMDRRVSHRQTIKKLGWFALISTITSLITCYIMFKTGLIVPN